MDDAADEKALATLPAERIDPAAVAASIRITFIRRGDEAEILLDGQSIFHIPVDPKAGDLGFVVHSIGASFVIGHMTLRPIYPAE